MRELFGEALGRFKVNPDLDSEQSYLAETTFGVQVARTRVRLTLFGNLIRNSLDQEVVVEDGVALRRRVNLKGSRVAGVELSGRARVDRLDFRWMGSVIYGRAYDESSNSYSRRLAERPDASGRVSATYAFGSGLAAHVETAITGRAFSLAEDNSFARLAPSAVVHLRGSWSLPVSTDSGPGVDVFLRVNNVTGAVTLPQLGLPGPGREIRAGVTLQF
jgi:iron complex outermembrane receptor protein